MDNTELASLWDLDMEPDNIWALLVRHVRSVATDLSPDAFISNSSLDFLSPYNQIVETATKGNMDNMSAVASNSSSAQVGYRFYKVSVNLCPSHTSFHLKSCFIHEISSEVHKKSWKWRTNGHKHQPYHLRGKLTMTECKVSYNFATIYIIFLLSQNMAFSFVHETYWAKQIGS